MVSTKRMRLFAKLTDRAEHIELDFVEMRMATGVLSNPAVNTFVVQGMPSQTFMEHAYESGAICTFGIQIGKHRLLFEGFVCGLEQEGTLTLADIVTSNFPTILDPES